jgi:hypothetical protein
MERFISTYESHSSNEERKTYTSYVDTFPDAEQKVFDEVENQLTELMVEYTDYQNLILSVQDLYLNISLSETNNVVNQMKVLTTNILESVSDKTLKRSLLVTLKEIRTLMRFLQDKQTRQSLLGQVKSVEKVFSSSDKISSSSTEVKEEKNSSPIEKDTVPIYRKAQLSSPLCNIVKGPERNPDEPTSFYYCYLGREAKQIPSFESYLPYNVVCQNGLYLTKDMQPVFETSEDGDSNYFFFEDAFPSCENILSNPLCLVKTESPFPFQESIKEDNPVFNRFRKMFPTLKPTFVPDLPPKKPLSDIPKEDVFPSQVTVKDVPIKKVHWPPEASPCTPYNDEEASNGDYCRTEELVLPSLLQKESE